MRLLEAFRGLFEGQPYRHRDSSLGDSVAVEVYEDLYELARAPNFRQAVDETRLGLGPRNKAVTLQRMRRGDGTLGELIDPDRARSFEGYALARGTIATIDCGVEVKILSKAMIKQIDRVVGDLTKQVANWQRVSKDAIAVAVMGINHAESTVGYEGERSFRTDGRTHKHPIQEAAAAERHIVERVVAPSVFHEVILLRYRATNEGAYAFEWVDAQRTRDAYQAALIRLSREINGRV